MNALRTVVVAGMVACAAHAGYGMQSVVVRDGVPVATIVIPRKNTPVELEAAQELQTMIRAVSGARLEIVPEGKESPEKTFCFYIGGTEKSGKLNLHMQKLKIGGFYLKSIPGGLVMTGRDHIVGKDNRRNKGTLYSVYELVERELKIRWIYPGDDGMVFEPRKTILCGNYDLMWNPPFIAAGMRGDIRWTLRTMRPVYSSDPWIRMGHNFFDWYKRFGNTHPDWFAHEEGKIPKEVTMVTSMCVSNPEFHRQIVKDWQDACIAHPGNKYLVNVIENDTPGTCNCKNCRAWDGPDKRFRFITPDPKALGKRNVGNRYAHFWLEVWKLASKIDPDAKVFAYAYVNYFYAPHDVKLNSNITVSLVPPADQQCFPYPPENKREILDNMRAWVKTGARLMYRPNVWNGYAMPENTVKDYYDEFQAIRPSLLGVTVDGPHASYATMGPMIYVMARLAVHPDASLESLLDEYYSGFGKAAPAMAKYWGYWQKYAHDHAEQFTKVPFEYNRERHIPNFGFHCAFYAHILFPAECFVPAEAFLREADELAKDSPADLKRVHFIRAGFEHARLCVEACRRFADTTCTNEERLEAVNKVYAYRNTLPQYACDLKYYVSPGMNENAAWVFPTFDPAQMMMLPVKWKLKTDPETAGETKKYYAPECDVSRWNDVLTDRYLERQGYEDYRCAWFRTEFTIPPKFAGKRTELVLGAVDESGWIWVNGKYVGGLKYDPAIDPLSYQKPLKFEITRFLKEKGANVLVVKVVNEAGAGGLCKPSRLQFFDDRAESLPQGRFYRKDNAITLKLWGDGVCSFLVDPKADGASTLKLTSNPRSPNTLVAYHLPFRFAAGKKYTYGGSIRVDNSSSGTVSIALIQCDKNGKTVKMDNTGKTPADGLEHRVSKTTLIHPDACRLTLHFNASGLNGEAAAYFASFFAVPAEANPSGK